MGTWRCPHCRTPQAETSRCWVCFRSTTNCSTCANFRRGISRGFDFCALDRVRVPLRGDEILPCWTDPAGGGEALLVLDTQAPRRVAGQRTR